MPATGPSGTAVTFTATGMDNCPGVSVVCSPASGTVFPICTTTVNCTAIDAAGQSCQRQFHGACQERHGADHRSSQQNTPITALKRLPSLDLNDPKVQHTIQLMVGGHKAIDPTLGIHERLTLNRDGQVPPGAVDYLDHMPIGYRRNAMKAPADTSAPGDDQAYRLAFEKMLAMVRILHDRGVFIVFGTDTGGSFTYHRELELYQRVGMTPPEILKRATFECAKYVGQDQQLGSIEKGKLADFFLVPGDPTKELRAIKTISMVVKDGTFYYPSEVYPKFGIEPFASAPELKQAVESR